MKLIKLTQGKYAQVDDEDFEELNKFKWCAVKGRSTFYATRNLPGKASINGRQKTVLMHRAIVNAPPGMEGDHIDGNGINNQKGNLRIATRQENTRNQIEAHHDSKLGIKGVCLDRKRRKFQAQISVDGKKFNLGYFFCLEKAKRIYRQAELECFGEFARKQTNKTNNIPS